MTKLEALLRASVALHHHLCPRQVLGVRMALLAGRLLDLSLPQQDKRLLTFAEMDGCTTDGLAVASGCRVGRRTMRILDFGKVAATFFDTVSSRAIRIAPHPRARGRAAAYAPEASSRWEAYLLGYQRMPDDALLTVQGVTLTVSPAALLSREGYRVNCAGCGEEIFNQREVMRDGVTLCRACAWGLNCLCFVQNPTISELAANRSMPEMESAHYTLDGRATG